MKRRTYSVLFVATLALFIFALVRPEFVMSAYTRLLPASKVRYIPTVKEIPKPTKVVIERVIPEEIDTPDENIDKINGTFETPEPNVEEVDIQGISFEIEIPDEIPDEIEEAIVEAPPEIGQNRLVVAAMGVDTEIHDGPDQSTLNKGLWHIPGSANPGENGNIVISSHRWLFKPPSTKTFYHIDRIKVGDPITYDYEGVRYHYDVTAIDIVNPEDVHILDQSLNKLTLFTCHPLFSTKQRIVVSAELVAVES